MGAEEGRRKRGDHVTVIKQIVRVGTTCSTVDEQGRRGKRERNWLVRRLQGGKGGCRTALRGKGGGRSTTPRTTRTCVCTTITRVHALACGRALTYTHACAHACMCLALIRAAQRELDQGRTRHPDLWIREMCSCVRGNGTRRRREFFGNNSAEQSRGLLFSRSRNIFRLRRIRGCMHRPFDNGRLC